MKVILACLFVLGGLVYGEEPEWAKKKLVCKLEVTRNSEVRKGVQGYGLEVRLTYHGPKQQMVSRWDTFELIVVTKDGKEFVPEAWGADGTRGPGLSDYRMLRFGDSAVFGIRVSTYQQEGKWVVTWSDSFGTWYGCMLETLDGVKLVMKYSNEAKEDFKLKLSETSTLEVAKEQIWSGTVKSKAVPLIPEK